jgi:hypothetical protein
VSPKARADAYPPSGYRLRIADAFWQGALETMRAYGLLGHSDLGQLGSEALVYLGGVVCGEEMIVTGLYRLHHEPQGDRVVVTSQEARWLLQTLRARDEKLIGQLHSHRGRAGHSRGDDAWATSFHEGFLSIVVPRFGVGATAPADCAVLEYRGGAFVELDRREIERRIDVYPEIVERVALPLAPDVARAEEDGWRAFAARLKSIALKRP